MRVLRPKEVELMSVFWGTDTPLATAEVRELATEYSWSESSLGVMITRLVKFGFLEINGTFQKKHITCNIYRAAISKDKYYGELISESIGQASPAFVLGFLSNLKDNGKISRDTIDKMQLLLDTWKN